MKASDIPDGRVKQIIESYDPDCTGLYVIEHQLAEYPPKVVLAKLRQMVHKGRLDAECTCGCNGPYRLARTA